jgi:FkbM family methyltransferase
MRLLKSTVQNALRRLGYKPQPMRNERAMDASDSLFRWLRTAARIGTVIDIGANDGAFLEFLQRVFRAQRALAFEPLPSARALLESRDIPGITIFPHALSDTAGTTAFEVNAYGPASSMLPLASLSRTEFAQTATITQRIDVPTARLDDLVDPATLPRGLFIKMDVQGVEDRVIRGGHRVVSEADYVLVEVSFRPMYQGQALFEEVHAGLADLGFRLAGVKNQLSAASGEPLFGHFLYRARHL